MDKDNTKKTEIKAYGMPELQMRKNVEKLRKEIKEIKEISDEKIKKATTEIKTEKEKK